MPFPDEIGEIRVRVVPYRAAWADEFRSVAKRLSAALGEAAVSIDHIGSTSVPGLAAKDVLDIQVQCRRLDDPAIARAFLQLGFRLRPEPWNHSEESFGTVCPKRVFAPPAGGRPLNVHVRVAGAPNARYALLFRDFLRSHPDMRDAWGEFKSRLAERVDDLMIYGPIKEPATRILMSSAMRWAADAGWEPSASAAPPAGLH